jgi:hypothetical protein
LFRRRRKIAVVRLQNFERVRFFLSGIPARHGMSFPPFTSLNFTAHNSFLQQTIRGAKTSQTRPPADSDARDFAGRAMRSMP